MNEAVLSLINNKAKNHLMHEIIGKKYELIIFENVFDATNELKKRNNIKAILIDIEHANGDYWDFIYHVKTSKFYNKPMLILTSDNNKVFNEKIKEVQIEHLFYKPFGPFDILKKIETIYQ